MEDHKVKNSKNPLFTPEESDLKPSRPNKPTMVNTDWIKHVRSRF